MSGYLAVPNEAAALARRHPEYAGAIFLLWLEADADHYEPIDCADSWLMVRFSLSKRQARRLLDLLVGKDLLEILTPGDEQNARRVQLSPPAVENPPEKRKRPLNRMRDRNADRTANRSKQVNTGTTHESEPLPEPHAEPRTELISTNPRSTTWSGAALAVAEAEGLAVEVRLKLPEAPTPYTATIRAWDEEHRDTFADGYAWVFTGRDHDGSKVKRWIGAVGADNGHAVEGVERLRLAMRAYFAAVRRGAAFPKGDPPTTRAFDRDLAKWLGVGARAGPAPPKPAPPRVWDDDAILGEAARRDAATNPEQPRNRDELRAQIARIEQYAAEVRAELAAGRLPARPP